MFVLGVSPSCGSFAVAAATGQELLRLEKSADAMGSTYSIALYGTDRVKMEAAADAAFDEVRRLDDLLSNYKPDSEWSQVNRHAARTAGQGFAGVVRAALGVPGVQPRRAKARSISRSAR